MTLLPYFFLALAIVSEVVATTSLKATEGFTRLWPTLLTILGYGSAFYALSRTMDHIPVGITYAVWSGAGLVIITLLARVLYNQRPDLPAYLGMGLILAGILVMGIFSKSMVH